MTQQYIIHYLKSKKDEFCNKYGITALSEKIASLRTEEYLQERANRGSRDHALSLLKNAPDLEPKADDSF